jgi:hypothetical protein
MCNCGKGRRAAIPGTGPQVGGGSRGLPVSRAIPPTTVAPMSQPQPQPRSRGVIPIRRAAPVATVAPPPVVSQVALQQSAPVAIPSPPMRSRGGVRPAVGHGVDTAIWGPSAWYILHTLAELAVRSATETGDERLATHWASFIQDVAVSIPCPTCARHFRIWMGWVPFEASVGAAIVRARFAELHNMVNRTKRVPDWSGDLSTMYNGTADDVRGRIATMRGIIGDAMLNTATAMLNML